jgi:nucleoside-diphosphate-sugar epimerase
MNLTDKQILITGADGFIGSHLTETLLDMGCRVRALSLYNSFNDWGWLEVIKGGENLDLIDFIRRPYGTAAFIPLYAPTFTQKDKYYVMDTIDSTFGSSVGKYVNRFEQELTLSDLTL